MSTLTTQQVADRFYELALQEKWFEIQDELFADHVQSIEPVHSPYMQNASGKANVFQKGQAFVQRIQEVHQVATTPLIVAANHFTVGRIMDITVEGLGRIHINQIMLYQVENGKIILEQFFY
jgi:predicted ester cyclase